MSEFEEGSTPLGNLPRQDPEDRWSLIRDAVQFQIKLAIDGLRDVMLIPLSAIGALLNILGVRGTPLDFYNIVRWGKRTETAINLFGAAERIAPSAKVSQPPAVDSMLERVESLVVDQYHRGGITASAKEAIDKALDGLHKDKQP